jgi:hypothetical protein
MRSVRPSWKASERLGNAARLRISFSTGADKRTAQSDYTSLLNRAYAVVFGPVEPFRWPTDAANRSLALPSPPFASG